MRAEGSNLRVLPPPAPNFFLNGLGGPAESRILERFYAVHRVPCEISDTQGTERSSPLGGGRACYTRRAG
jgi:hypothetical protein